MITAIVLTKNEERNIVDCIESLLWCDEILVIDDNSEDKTVQIVEKLKNDKVKVIIHPLNNDFSKQRNFALREAKQEWVLFVDADERVSLSLQYEILSSITDSLSNYSGYYIRRCDNMWGKELKYGETGGNSFLRLIKTGTLRNPLIHHPHQDITQFLQEINFYTDLRANELFDKKIKVYWWTIIFYPLGKFIFNYGIKRGFLDGIRGLIFAILMSLHSFLVRGKLWQLWQKK